MAKEIRINIETPANEVLRDSTIPDDYLIRDVINELVDRLGLPVIGADGTRIEYWLYSLREESFLPLSASAGKSMQNGDTIRLGTDGKKPETPPPTKGEAAEQPPTMPENTDEIRVLLTVEDQNRHETILLATTVPVVDLIRKIVKDFNLPLSDHGTTHIKYTLASKFLGHVLLEEQTLAQAGIPPLDRLTLQRFYEAGGMEAMLGHN